MKPHNDTQPARAVERVAVKRPANDVRLAAPRACLVCAELPAGDPLLCSECREMSEAAA